LRQRPVFASLKGAYVRHSLIGSIGDHIWIVFKGPQR
jgi:hypothetical protein